MNIGIDVSQVIYQTGVSTYTENLIKNLLAIDHKNEYVLFGGSLRRLSVIEKFYRSLKGNFKGIAYPLPPTFLDFLWNRLHKLNIEYLIGKVDVFHSSDWTQPPTKAHKVTTVHDLVPILHPEWSHSSIISVFNRKLTWVKKEIDYIISVSESTKKDLIGLGFDNNKIVVIPEALDPIYNKASQSEVSNIRIKYEIKEKYLMAIGLTDRKNIKNIVKAFMKIRNDKKIDYQLVVVGYPHIKLGETSNFIKVIGHVNKEDLPALYSGADVLVYPSFYEGFGLPILEAMACETPVVTSNLSSMPEVAGDAAVLVNPESVESIANGILTAVYENKSLVKSGLKRVGYYSWNKTSKMTLDIYNKLS